MSNLFDGIQDSAFDVVTNVMGYDASWTPSGSSTPIPGRVLLKKPTEERELADIKVDFNPHIYFIEYKEGVFPGLLERIRANETTETIVIAGQLYDVMSIDALYDGKTLKAYTQKR